MTEFRWSRNVPLLGLDSESDCFNLFGIAILNRFDPPKNMEFKRLLAFVLLGSLTCAVSAETVIKVLHIQKLPKVLEIWKEAAHEFEKVHPGVFVGFHDVDCSWAWSWMARASTASGRRLESREEAHRSAARLGS